MLRNIYIIFSKLIYYINYIKKFLEIDLEKNFVNSMIANAVQQALVTWANSMHKLIFFFVCMYLWIYLFYYIYYHIQLSFYLIKYTTYFREHLDPCECIVCEDVTYLIWLFARVDGVLLHFIVYKYSFHL
jgi:hypothetical protein